MPREALREARALGLEDLKSWRDLRKASSSSAKNVVVVGSMVANVDGAEGMEDFESRPKITITSIETREVGIRGRWREFASVVYWSTS